MEIIRGKQSYSLGEFAFAQMVEKYPKVLIDLGTGDGRFVTHTAQSNSGLFVIGMDACRENLRESSRCAPDNALFVIANAMEIPNCIMGIAHQITINFPWGSLLEGLLDGTPGLLDGIHDMGCPGAQMIVRLNKSALAETGCTLEEGGRKVCEALEQTGNKVQPMLWLNSNDLRRIPSTWAKRMAFGRDPQAVAIFARKALIKQKGAAVT